MFTAAEAERLADNWLNGGRSTGRRWRVGLREFDRGYVVWPVPADGEPDLVGTGRGIIDRETGELSIWPSVPVDTVIEMYRDERARQLPVPRTWEPEALARRDLVRRQFPARVTHLTLADGRVITARSVKGDAGPRLHPLVRDFLDALPADRRERGHDRCSEAAAISDALHREDAGRAADHHPPVTVETARDTTLRGADLVTYRVREPGDPMAGVAAPPCLSCYQLLAHFGFQLLPPKGDEQQ